MQNGGPIYFFLFTAVSQTLIYSAIETVPIVQRGDGPLIYAACAPLRLFFKKASSAALT